MNQWCDFDALYDLESPNIVCFVVLKLEAPSLSVWAWRQCKEMRWAQQCLSILCTKDPNRYGWFQPAWCSGGPKKIRRLRKNRVIHKILPLWSDFFVSAIIFCSWNHPHLIILSAFLFFTKLNVWKTNSTKVCHEIKNFFCIPITTNAIQFLYIFLDFKKLLRQMVNIKI